MKLEEFDYQLPLALIAQRPCEPRDASRMMVVDRATGVCEDHEFRDLPELLRGDELLVVNNTRVIPARLFGKRAGVKAERAGKHGMAARKHLSAVIEVLLVRQVGEANWLALVRPGRKIGVGERILFGQGELEAEVVRRDARGLREIRFQSDKNLMGELERLGHVPLPPYIKRADEQEDRSAYQTMFARHPGAVAAPTAALHFTPEILARVKARGAETCEVTLHVGLGTFQPIQTEEIERHQMHAEWYEIRVESADLIRRAKRDGRPVLALGTTVVRALEDAAQRCIADGSTDIIRADTADASLFITPGHDFRVVDQLLTNFHLPRSSLLVLVSAFAGRELVRRAYEHAVQSRYRFYSYGDCMLIR